MNFALRLKELRELKNLTQAQFAKAFDIGIATIGMWESSQRKPPAQMLLKIADYFDVSVDYLLGREKEPTDKSIDSINPKIIQKLDEFGITPERLSQLDDKQTETLYHLIDTFLDSIK